VIPAVAFRGYVPHACSELFIVYVAREKYVRKDTARMRKTMPLKKKLCGKGTAERPRRRWEVNIRMDIK